MLNQGQKMMLITGAVCLVLVGLAYVFRNRESSGGEWGAIGVVVAIIIGGVFAER
jgi:hypothetical protein